MPYNAALSSPDRTRRRVIAMNYYPPRSRGFYSPFQRCTQPETTARGKPLPARSDIKIEARWSVVKLRAEAVELKDRHLSPPLSLTLVFIRSTVVTKIANGR